MSPRNRKLLHSFQNLTKWLPVSIAGFRSDIRHSEATPVSDVESSHLPGKNYESLLFRARLLVYFQSLPWQSICLTPIGKMNGIHPLEKKYFAVTKIQEKIRSVREKNRSGCISQRRNGSGFGYMAARPYTMSQRWRCLATQTNALSSMPWLWFIGRVWPDRGGAAHL
jgi:hypothetical protein